MTDKANKQYFRKRNPIRKKKITLLIVCEGLETERHYFDLLKRDDRVAERFVITVKKGKGGSREQIALHAVDRMEQAVNPHDEVWCVMDVEHQLHKASLKKSLAILNRNTIKPCLSNPAFEVWFLAHFERTAQAFADCDAVTVRLNQQVASGSVISSRHRRPFRDGRRTPLGVKLRYPIRPRGSLHS